MTGVSAGTLEIFEAVHPMRLFVRLYKQTQYYHPQLPHNNRLPLRTPGPRHWIKYLRTAFAAKTAVS